jgi:hypothetical protein
VNSSGTLSSQELQSRRDALFFLLGAPRPLDATIRVFEGKPLLQVSSVFVKMQPVAVLSS